MPEPITEEAKVIPLPGRPCGRKDTISDTDDPVASSLHTLQLIDHLLEEHFRWDTQAK